MPQLPRPFTEMEILVLELLRDKRRPVSMAHLIKTLTPDTMGLDVTSSLNALAELGLVKISESPDGWYTKVAQITHHGLEALNDYIEKRMCG